MTVPNNAIDGIGTGQDSKSVKITSVYQFSIETASESLTDLDLHIVPIHSKNAIASSSKSIPAKWIRKRTLTENEEIVDQIIDVEKKKLCWTSHRPTRGWYQYLRSPMLPPNVRLPLQPPKGNVKSVVGSTPLSLTISTRLQLSQLDRLHCRIHCPDMNQEEGENLSGSNADFTSVNLSGNDSANTINNTTQSSAIRTTGIENSSTSQKGHTRRRSAGNSVSHNGKGRISNPSSTPVVPEEEMYEDVSQSSTMVEEQETEQSKGTETGRQDEVRSCTFILTDDMATVMQVPTRDVQTSANTGWARWAWSMLPDIVRPALRLDGSKSFSIVWIDAPSTSTQASQHVEIVRFEDQSGLMSWKGKRIGKLLIQKHAVQALNLDLGLWITLALAYLEFLEERDGYNASSDG